MAFMSVWRAWLPTLRWTKMAPGARPRIWLACFLGGVEGRERFFLGPRARAASGGVGRDASEKEQTTHRHARVRAPDPQVVGVLLVQQALEELGVVGDHVGGPRSNFFFVFWGGEGGERGGW
jgi:hypothetical protein